MITDETSYQWSRISVWRKAGVLIFWFGVASLVALFFWSAWEVCGVAVDWIARQGW